MGEENKNAVGPVTGGGALAQPGEPRLGFEDPTDTRDLIIPFVKLFQGNSTEAEKFPEAKGGQLLNSLTQEVLSEEFVPCFKWTEWSKFNGNGADDPNYDPALGEPGALLWRTMTPTAEQAAECEFGPNGEKPKASRSMCFLVYVIGQQMPLVLRFAKTSFAAGKKLISLAQFSGGNMFDRKYKLTTKKEQNESKKIYYVLQVALAGIASEEERRIAKQWYQDFKGKAIKGKAIKVHEEGDQVCDGAASAAPDFQE